jgi:hypothetical protein
VTYGPIGRIRAKVRAGRYRFTSPTLHEMGEDGLSSVEIEQSVLAGRIARIQRDEHGRRRFTVEGRSRSGRRITSLCRYDDTGDLQESKMTAADD